MGERNKNSNNVNDIKRKYGMLGMLLKRRVRVGKSSSQPNPIQKGKKKEQEEEGEATITKQSY
eukprot:gene7595-5356_t